MTDVTVGEPSGGTRRRGSRGAAGINRRRAAARGTLINGAFDVGLNLLGFARGFVVAALVSNVDYGIWGVLVVSLGTLSWLKQVGIGDKFIQQDEEDQELAFQRAFTLEALFNGIFLLLLLPLIPLLSVIYGKSVIIAPGLVLLLCVPAVVLQTPLWVYYREMRYSRQRILQAADPLTGFVLAIGLAALGCGYWSLVAASVAGAWAAAMACMHSAPYKLRFRYDRGTLKRYAGFSWPLFAAGGSGIIIAQGSILAGEQHLGLAAVGSITLAANITLFTNGLDQIVTTTLYPAVCAVADRTALLFETFVKSNRLALMWAVPFGTGLALFAPDLINFIIGTRWRPAEHLLQAFGIIAALNHLGFNWDAYFRARAHTRPVGIVAALTAVAFLCVTLPLLLTHGIDGFAIGMSIQTAVNLTARTWFLRRLFAGFDMLSHAVRSLLPTVIAVVPVLLVRALVWSGGRRTWPEALAELILYAAVTIAATLVLERPLLREVMGYLRRPRGGAEAPPIVEVV